MILKVNGALFLIRRSRFYVIIPSTRNFSDENKKPPADFSVDAMLKILDSKRKMPEIETKLEDKTKSDQLKSERTEFLKKILEKKPKSDFFTNLFDKQAATEDEATILSEKPKFPTEEKKPTISNEFAFAKKRKGSLEAEAETLDKNLVDAADEVAKILGGEKIKSDLLKKLVSTEKESAEAAKPGISDVLSSMIVTKRYPEKRTKEQIDKFQKSFAFDEEIDETKVQQRIDQLRKRFDRDSERDVGPAEVDRQRPGRSVRQVEKETSYPEIDLLDGERLNIFEREKLPEEKSTSVMELWDNLESKHIKWLTTQSPRNGFEEMIRWTEQGKVFPYPIDNEFGFYEKHVGFHEHVFLDHLIKDGFPESGPIRRFMELVVVGLSKNPYMGVEKKRGHIEWFRNYFAGRFEEIDKLKQIDEEEARLKQTQ